MGDIRNIPASRKNHDTSGMRLMKSYTAATSPICSSRKASNYMKNLALGGEPSSQILLFLLKVAALEVVRRFSKRRYPFVWNALQATQVLSFPPLKWIQRWAPFKGLINGLQVFAKPILFLSVATAFSSDSQRSANKFDNINDSQSCPVPTTNSEATINPTASDIRVSGQSSENSTSNSVVLHLRAELQKHGVTLPERINDEELQRFHTAANGDFSCLSQLLTRTICWRESFRFLSVEELDTWSRFVFWHGNDVHNRPCLIIRLGLACCTIVPRDRTTFVQAIVSQCEHGVLYLVNGDDPRFTVVMDCEGLSPLRFPTKMLRSCSTLMQDHYPNRLATLLIVRLPPVVRVVAQTFIQVLKPSTRQKLRIEGDTYKKVLDELLQSFPSFLGGKCACVKCSILPFAKGTNGLAIENVKTVSNGDIIDDEFDAAFGITELYSCSYEHVLKNVVISLLMLWMFITLLVKTRGS